MRHVVFYISGHGYGHATRSIELIRTLASKSSDLYFHIKTNAPQWIFDLNLQENYTLHNLRIDVGAVQQTSFFIDKSETLNQWTDLLGKRESIVAEETAFVKTVSAPLIIGDIPPFAFDIADRANIPGVAITNFSWDWVYEDYIDEHPGFSKLVDQIRRSYRKTELLLRLPFHGDLSVFPRIKDIPLIARKAFRSKEEIWKLLGVERGRPILVLVALRASDLSAVDLARAFSSNEFLFVTFGLDAEYENNLNLPPNFIRFSELVNGCDLVISKPGYGIVSEIIANQTPMLFTSRDDFVEYAVLVTGLEEHAVSQLMPREDYFAGNWHRYLNRLLNATENWNHIPLNGAACAADEILRLI